MTAKSDISAAIRILLGRRPSEAAFVELQSRPLKEIIYNIFTSKEFRTAVIEPIAKGDFPIHDEKGIILSSNDLQWTVNHIPIREQAREQLKSARTWSQLISVLSTDPRLSDEIVKHFGHSTRTEYFFEVVRLVRGAQSIEGRKTSHDKASPLVDDSPQINHGTLTETSLAIDVPRHVVDQIEPAKAAFAKLGRVNERSARGQILNLYKRDSGIGIIWLYQQARESIIIPRSVKDYIAFTASRVYLRLFMSETAFRITSELMERISELTLFSESEIGRLRKTYALAAIRSGHANIGLSQYETLVALNPLDWESYFLLGDFIMQTEPERAKELFLTCIECNNSISPNIVMTIAEFFGKRGNIALAIKLLKPLQDADTVHPDVYTVLANVAVRSNVASAWRKHLASHFEAQGLSGKDILIEKHNALFGFGSHSHLRRADHPSVTIVMTSFNSSATIECAATSVLQQTNSNLELIIVDDCSSDGSRDLIARLAQRDDRVRYLFNDYNIGTYCSKNKGVVMATGDFITFHDSDDWMHPQRLERHLTYTDRNVGMTISNWLRMKANGEAVLRKGGGFIHRNPASTFFRREIFEKIGVFDSVRTGADTEMVWRVKHTYGAASVLEMNEVLGLGLHHENSLTTAGVTAFDEYRFSSVRLSYWESWVKWHFERMLTGAPLTIPINHYPRQFSAPKEIAVSHSDNKQLHNMLGCRPPPG